MSTLEEILPDIRKVDKKFLFKSAEGLGLKTSDVRGTAKVIAAEFVKLPDSQLAECTECDGKFDAKKFEGLPCPYCGGTDDEGASTDDSIIPAPPVNGSVVLAGARTEKDLNAAVKRVHALQSEGGKNLWNLGKAIGQIYDEHLWKQRTNEEGKAIYKSFEQFVTKELRTSKQTAMWLMDVSKAFDEKLALEYGMTKLGHILQAPKEDRQLLLDQVAAGATVREIKDSARESRAAHGGRELPRETDARGGRIGRRAKAVAATKSKKTSAAKKTAAKKDTITVAKLLGKFQVKLFKKPEKKGEEPTTRARRLADKPWGQQTLENGVVITYIVNTSSAGEIFLSCNVERSDA